MIANGLCGRSVASFAVGLLVAWSRLLTRLRQRGTVSRAELEFLTARFELDRDILWPRLIAAETSLKSTHKRLSELEFRLELLENAHDSLLAARPPAATRAEMSS